MFILSQFTYNAFRFVELNLHKLVSLLWKTSWIWQETGIWKKNGRGGGAKGISPRASNWLETALIQTDYSYITAVQSFKTWSHAFTTVIYTVFSVHITIASKHKVFLMCNENIWFNHRNTAWSSFSVVFLTISSFNCMFQISHVAELKLLQ